MQPKKFDTINVVPMIDIMLVLLVIVLTTATFIAKGIIPLNLPTAKSSTPMKKDKRVSIEIDKSGVVYIEGKKIITENLQQELNDIDKKSPVFISCDKLASYEVFVNVLNLLREIGFSKISIVTVK